jgi:gliding motility-associated-like protein
MITLSADTTYASYLWQDGTTFPYQQVNKTGIYSVKASIGNCSSSDTIRISYKSAPYFDLGKDVFLCRGQQMQLTPYVDTRSSFQWQDGSTAPIYNVKGEGVYILTATNECGSFTDSVKVLYGICALQMPTAFTPNSDGLNDVFKVTYVSPKRFRMVIYNRWGQKVYESTDITKGWDGNYRGMTSPADTYIWKIILTDSGGKEQEAHGTVTVIR